MFFNRFHDDVFLCFPKIQIDTTISQQRQILGVAHRLLQSQNVLLFAGRVHRFVGWLISICFMLTLVGKDEQSHGSYDKGANYHASYT